ncbi:YopX family protein [Enterococcus faecalis]|uniref:YopX family protein n=1 Tax=Enterococcus faecalis TaxID=1351 RepID=UPI003D7CF3D6
MIPKFRAWDKNTNDMVDVKTIDLEKDGSIGCIVDYNGINLDVSECVLMQYTGLKDKNGVEIFEGDLVKVIDGESEEDSYISVVKNYSNEGYPAFDIEYPPNYHYDRNVLSAIMCNGFETIEVIGNVYEDGDLLNDSEDTKRN